jgi:Nucleoside-diphosphate-sugar epimerases
MKEEYLLSGFLEPTNEPYAIAKIAGIKMCQSYNRQYGTNFISVMPTNLYGPQDNFDLETSHVLPALIRKFHLAKLAATNCFEALQQDESFFGLIPWDIKTSLGLTEKTTMKEAKATPTVVLWGSGTPRREFLHVDDLADACLFLMNNYDESEIINIGVGKDFTIRELAEATAKIVGFQGEVVWDTSKPDGTPQKLLDISRLNQLGWKAKISLGKGVAATYKWYVNPI